VEVASNKSSNMLEASDLSRTYLTGYLNCVSSTEKTSEAMRGRHS